MGIRGQLTLLVPGVVAIALTVVAFIAVRQTNRDALEEFKELNLTALEALSVTVATSVAQNDIAGLDTVVAHAAERLEARGLVELAVLDDDGRVMAHSSPERFNRLLTDPFSRQAIEADGPVWLREGAFLRLGTPAKSGIRWATVTARFSLERLEDDFSMSRRRAALGTLGLFLFIAGAVFLGLNRVVIRPVKALEHSVRRMGEGHLSTRVPPMVAGRELRELGDIINRMAQALQAERENLERTVTERTRELQEANARLERLAVTDGLTGLFNHRRFQEALHSELLRCERHKRPLAVLMLDVDFFKKVNDSLGHPAGDELLRRLAEVLSKDLRQTDLIARYGGEEFAVLLPETTKAEALQVGERMREAVEARINENTTWPQRITVSVGVATFPEDARSAEALLEASDQALYVAKRQGRNRVVGAKAA
ncbi:MAG: diguanylate cyclase [Myxococcaceae bacterium]|jgi:diguanylate cyclase (GGDEF)-like protein|nr:diguanylate cyclase [Myxococcaceae bacterium]